MPNTRSNLNQGVVDNLLVSEVLHVGAAREYISMFPDVGKLLMQTIL